MREARKLACSLSIALTASLPASVVMYSETSSPPALSDSDLPSSETITVQVSGMSADVESFSCTTAGFMFASLMSVRSILPVTFS